jgi:hypothetical protein
MQIVICLVLTALFYRGADILEGQQPLIETNLSSIAKKSSEALIGITRSERLILLVAV